MPFLKYIVILFSFILLVSSANVTIKVSQGWLEGEQLELVTRDGWYWSFKGIPYAAPPVGKLRFKAPQPPLPWNGVKKATAHGSQCPQRDLFTKKWITSSEDCLFLNVYTRNLYPKVPRPVMVFVHGGAFLSGSGNDNNYGPDFLVNHEVVVVTINYRLGALGFLCLDTEDVPGNAGLKDQVAAFIWVKKNIKSFGGDSDNVTIFGQSAGGASIALHIISPMSKGLFKRSISMSGVPYCDWSLPYKPRQRAFILGKILGKDTDDPKELLEFLQSIPQEKLIDANPTVLTSEEITNNPFKMNYFTPVVEKHFGREQFLIDGPLEMLKRGMVNEVDVFIGHTEAEVLFVSDLIVNNFSSAFNRYPEMVVPRKLLIQCTPNVILEASASIHNYYFGNRSISKETLPELVKYFTESSFVYDIHNFGARLSKVCNTKSFFYIFSCYSGRNLYGNAGAKYGMYGAAHLDDTLYLFDAKSLNMTIDKGSREYKLVQLVNTVFTNFAKYGTPTPDKSLGIIWPEYDSFTKKYVTIEDQLKIGANYKRHELCFWRDVFNNADVEF